MMYLNISDGIFLEVGGTSTDISVIRNGKALVKGAEVGGHRVYLRTLDVKTVGVAGGSMYRVGSSGVHDVGPRSAHIAGLGYVAFSKKIDTLEFSSIVPRPGDPSDYLCISTDGQDKPTLCLTPTCAANFLGLVPDLDCARGNDLVLRQVFDAWASKLKMAPEALAKMALEKAFDKCLPIIKQFISDYKLDPDTVSLVGGGGGAAALVPFIAQSMRLNHALAENADVISAIGVALALVRETVERNIVDPRQEDILSIRQEALESVQAMGADPSSIEVHVEVDTRANIVRATACGAAGLTQDQARKEPLPESEKLSVVAQSLKVLPELITVTAQTPFFQVYACQKVDKHLFGLLPAKRQSLRVVDRRGIIRLQVRHGVAQLTSAGQADQLVSNLAEEYAQYGDAGKVIPNVILLLGPKIVDLSGLPDVAQVLALVRAELSVVSSDKSVIVVGDIA